jgi:transcriptional regulator with XRE-family HTH domain
VNYRQMILKIIELGRYNQTHLAKEIGVSRSAMYRFLYKGKAFADTDKVIHLLEALEIDVNRAVRDRLLECIPAPSVTPRAKLRRLTSTKMVGHSL